MYIDQPCLVELLKLPGQSRQKVASPTFFRNTRAGFLSEAAIISGTSAYHLAAVYEDGLGETTVLYLYRVGDKVSPKDVHTAIADLVPHSVQSRRGPYSLDLVHIALISPTEEGYELLTYTMSKKGVQAH